MRAAIYCRISRDRVGAGLGVDRQERECRELAKRLGLEVVLVLADNDLSAYSGKRRPSYEQLLDAITAGTVDVVIAWHPDRLHRSPKELERYIDVCEPRSVPTHSVKAGELDLATASGRMTARIVGAVARHESEHKSERIKSQRDELAASGGFNGGIRRFGYEPDGVTVRMVEAELIAGATRKIVAGASVGSVARWWNGTGITTSRGNAWTPVLARQVLLRPRNAGLREHRGKVAGKAAWPAVVSEDQWRAVVAVLTDPARRWQGSLSLKWQGSDIYVCGKCGARMRSSAMRTARGNQPTYRCRAAAHNAILAVPVDELVDEVAKRVLREHGADLLAVDRSGEVKALREDAVALQQRIDALADDLDIDERTLARRDRALRSKLTEVEGKLAQFSSGSPLAGIADAPDPGAAFEALTDVERRRGVVGALMSVTISNATRRGRAPAGQIDYDRVDIEPKVKR